MFNSEIDFKVGSKPKLNVGFVSLWFERGQAYITKMLRDAIYEDHNVFILGRNATNDPENIVVSGAAEFLVPNVTMSPTYVINPDDFTRWIKSNNLDVIIFNEEQQIELVQISKDHQIKTIGYYVWELFNPVNVRILNEYYDCIIAQTDVCFDHYNRIGLQNVRRVCWGIDKDFITVPKEITDPVKFFHPGGWGGLHGRRGTEYLLDIPDIVMISQRDKTFSRPEMIKMYQDADVIVLPSKWEGLGLTFLEAIGCGKPIITVDQAPMNEFVLPMITGWTVPVEKFIKYDDIFIKSAEITSECLSDLIESIRHEPEYVQEKTDQVSILQKTYSFDQFKKNVLNLIET